MGFIGLVKKPLNLKRGFLNPSVVNEKPKVNKRVKKALAKQKVQTGDGRSLSPITSEDEDFVRNFSAVKAPTEQQEPINKI